jgi:hypothetical protein
VFLVACLVAVVACVDLSRPSTIGRPTDALTSGVDVADASALPGADVAREVDSPSLGGSALDAPLAPPLDGPLDSATDPVSDVSPDALSTLALGLVGHWNLDEGAGTTAADFSGNGLTGTLVNLPAWLTTGIPGGVQGNRAAVRFDGVNDYVAVAANSQLVITGDISIALWINRSKVLTYGGVLSKTAASGKWDYDLFFDESSDDMRFDSDTTSPREVRSVGTIAVTGRWYHFAVTRRGTDVAFFIGGQPSGTATMNGAFPSTSAGINIGREDQRSSTYFAGALDDVRIWNRALSSEEVAAIAAGSP